MPANPLPARPDPVPPRRPPRLREVPGGYDIDRWPITVPVAAGETIPGWLMRVGVRYQLTPAQLLHDLGVLDRPASPDRVLMQVSLHTERITTRLGLPPSALSAGWPMRPIDAALARFLVFCRQTRPRLGGSRFCPRCLAQPAGVWQTAWTNPLQPVCLGHRLHLRATCPGCEQVPWTRTAWLHTLVPPSRCPQRRARDPADPRKGSLCRHDLRDSPTSPADPALCATQQYLSDLAVAADLELDPTTSASGVATTAATAFDTFCELVADAVGIDHLLALDADPRHLTAAMVTAHTVLAPDRAR